MYLTNALSEECPVALRILLRGTFLIVLIVAKDLLAL